MKHFNIVTATHGLDIAIAGPDTYEVLAPETKRTLKELGILRMLDRAYDAGLKACGKLRMGMSVKWEKMPKEHFKVVGITRDKVMIEGDFSQMYNIIQTDWVPIEEVKERKS